MDDKVCQYVKALCGAGGVVNGKIVSAVAHALLLFYNPSIGLGNESGEHVAVTKAVSRSIFRKLGYTKRKDTKTAKKTSLRFSCCENQVSHRYFTGNICEWYSRRLCYQY